MDTTGSIVLSAILDHERINANQFAESISLKRTQPIYDILNGKVKKITPNYANKILSTYPHYNYSWLLTGKGEMLKQNKRSEATLVTWENSILVEVPIVPVVAQAGYLVGFGDQEYIEELPTIPVFVDKEMKGKYIVFEVHGDSMDDRTDQALKDRDKILCREIKHELWKHKLHIRDWNFVIVSKTEGITVKQIIEHDVDNARILCHPLNPLFENFWIELNEVIELYNVIKIVDRSAKI